jgi:hypothetical protein
MPPRRATASRDNSTPLAPANRARRLAGLSRALKWPNGGCMSPSRSNRYLPHSPPIRLAPPPMEYAAPVRATSPWPRRAGGHRAKIPRRTYAFVPAGLGALERHLPAGAAALAGSQPAAVDAAGASRARRGHASGGAGWQRVAAHKLFQITPIMLDSVKKSNVRERQCHRPCPRRPVAPRLAKIPPRRSPPPAPAPRRPATRG